MEIKQSKNHDDTMQMKSTQARCGPPFQECASTLKALSLPEILEVIFSYLDVQSKGRASQVSWLWHDNIERPQLWRDVRVTLEFDEANFTTAKKHCLQSFPLLTKLTIGSTCRFRDNTINIIVQSFRNLVSLEVSNCFNGINDLGLIQIIDNLKSLRHLDLTDCYGITDKGVAALCGRNGMTSNGNLPILHSLSLSSNNNLTDEALNFLSIGQPELINLNLSNNRQITDIGLKSLSRLVNIRVLNISKCKGISGNGMVHLAHMTNLIDLNLSWNHYIARAGLELLASGDSQITSLILNHCIKVDDQCGPPLACLTNLTKLTLGYTNIGDTVLQCLANGPGSIRLDTLDLRYCVKLTNAAGPPLACLANLTKLILSSTYIDNTVLQCLANGPGAIRLATLDIKNCYKLTNAAGPPLAQLTNLTKLILDFTTIGDTVLMCLANGIGAIRLDTLSLRNCGMLTFKAGQHLAMMSNLRLLDLTGTRVDNAGLKHLARALNLRIGTQSLARSKNVEELSLLVPMPQIAWAQPPPSWELLNCWIPLNKTVTMKMINESRQWEEVLDC